jgi:hypothetical protein
MVQDQAAVERRTKKMGQVQALLDRAANTPFSAEAEAALAKATDLMTAFQIEEWELGQLAGNKRPVPERRTFSMCQRGNPLEDELANLVTSISQHAKVRVVFHGLGTGLVEVRVTSIGFPEDLDFLEMLYVSLQLQMAANLTPTPDPSLQFDENLALLKEAGMKWQDIHRTLQAHGIEPPGPWERRIGVGYTKKYTDYCNLTGRPRLRTSPGVYQRNFATGFVLRVDERFKKIREAQAQAPGTDIVLRDRADEVNRLFKEAFPKLHMVKSKFGKLDHAAMGAGRSAGDRADLGSRKVSRRKEIG